MEKRKGGIRWFIIQDEGILTDLRVSVMYVGLILIQENVAMPSAELIIKEVQ